MSVRGGSSLSVSVTGSTRSHLSASSIARTYDHHDAWMTAMNCKLNAPVQLQTLSGTIRNTLDRMLVLAPQQAMEHYDMIQALVTANLPPTMVAEIEGWETETDLLSNYIPFPQGYQHRSRLSDLADAMKAKKTAEEYVIQNEDDETRWQENVWNKALGKDRDAWETSFHMKLPDAGVYGNGLPAHLKGSYQKPDYVWVTAHDIANDHATIGLQANSMSWTECNGEGKPVRHADYPSNDHALRQVIMAGAAGLYHQISLLETHPEILLFTVNLNIVRFFVMTAASIQGQPKWSLVCRQIGDVILDLTDLMDCIRLRCLTRALREADAVYSNHFQTLWQHSELVATQGRAATCWWVRGRREGSHCSDNTRPTLSSNDSVADSSNNPTMGQMSQWGSNMVRPTTGAAAGVNEGRTRETPSGGHRTKWEKSIGSTMKWTTRRWRFLTNALRSGGRPGSDH